MISNSVNEAFGEDIVMLKNQRYELERKDAAIAEQARQLKETLAELEQVKRERDAAVRDIKNVVTHYPCYVCKHSQYAHGCGCDIAVNLQSEEWKCSKGEFFEWRGSCAENGGTEDADTAPD